jgi:hypothetical protein
MLLFSFFLNILCSLPVLLKIKNSISMLVLLLLGLAAINNLLCDVILPCGYNFIMLVAAPWLWQLVASLSPQRPRFEPRLVRVGFVVDKVTLGQVFL